MPISVRVSSRNIQSTIRGLDRVRNQLTNLSPFWRSTAIPLIKMKLRDVFLQQGPGWEPLAESTIRSRQFPTLPILQQTGSLMSSVVDNPVLEVNRKSLLYGSSNPYAQFHEHGTSRMPARPFLRPGIQRAMDQIRREYLNYIRQDPLRF